MAPLAYRPSPTSPDDVDRLSERQRVCLRLAAQGLTSAEIGERLSVSSRTVDEHLMRACHILGVRTRVQAVARLAFGERSAPEPRSFRP